MSRDELQVARQQRYVAGAETFRADDEGRADEKQFEALVQVAHHKEEAREAKYKLEVRM